VMPLTKYPRPEPRAQVIQQIEDRLRHSRIGGAVGIATSAPMRGGFVRRLSIAGQADTEPERRPEVTMVAISDAYFEAIGAPLVRGRAFGTGDGTAGHESAIVNQRFASMHFPGEDPLGRQVTLYDMAGGSQASPARAVTIVGIAPTIRQRGMQDALPDPVVFLPYRADPQRGVVMLVRAAGDAGAVTAALREEVRAVEPDLPLYNVLTLDEALARDRWPYRVFGMMFGLFAVFALVLSAVGLYAVTAYSVTQRAPEIGIRMALGAQAVQVRWLVLRRAAGQLLVGVPIGIAGALGVGRLLQSLLVQTSSRDAWTLASIVVVMIAVSIMACLLPARRATRLNPLQAMR
jgi:putative ABC transport system permease protein